MIERITRLPQDSPNNVVSARISALMNTYEQSIGIDIFKQVIDGEVTALFGGMDNSFSLLAGHNALFSELDAYFRLLGSTVFCFNSIAENLNSKQKNTFLVYELIDNKDCSYGVELHGSIKSVYDMLLNGQDGDIDLPPFEYWYTDFCLRYNHNAGEYALSENAVAVAGFISEGASLITGVATKKEARGNGEGSRCLKALIHNIRTKYPKSRIFSATTAAHDFYIKNGFVQSDECAILKY